MVIGSWLKVSVYFQFTTVRCISSAVYCPLLIVSCLLLAVCCELSSVSRSCLLSAVTICCILSAGYSATSSVNFNWHCLLLAGYCQQVNLICSVSWLLSVVQYQLVSLRCLCLLVTDICLMFSDLCQLLTVSSPLSARDYHLSTVSCFIGLLLAVYQQLVWLLLAPANSYWGLTTIRW